MLILRGGRASWMPQVFPERFLSAGMTFPFRRGTCVFPGMSMFRTVLILPASVTWPRDS